MLMWSFYIGGFYELKSVDESSLPRDPYLWKCQSSRIQIQNSVQRQWYRLLLLILACWKLAPQEGIPLSQPHQYNIGYFTGIFPSETLLLLYCVLFSLLLLNLTLTYTFSLVLLFLWFLMISFSLLMMDIFFFFIAVPLFSPLLYRNEWIFFYLQISIWHPCNSFWSLKTVFFCCCCFFVTISTIITSN